VAKKRTYGNWFISYMCFLESTITAALASDRPKDILEAAMRVVDDNDFVGTLRMLRKDGKTLEGGDTRVVPLAEA
jgi:hypothetical protein